MKRTTSTTSTPEKEKSFRLLNQAVEQVPVQTLRPHPRNVNQGDLGAIHESIKHHGFWGTIVAQRSTGYVLAGNHRLLAAVEMGATEVPVAWVDVDDEQALKILLADNRTTRLGHDDPDALAKLLQELAEGPGLDGTGFDGDDLDELLRDLGIEQQSEAGDDPGAQIDRAAELREKWGTERGQIWAIQSKTVPGKSHRLMCGDSTSAEDVGRLMGGEKADCMWTDPPYGVSYVGKTKDALTIENDGAEGLAGLLTAAFAAVDSAIAPSRPWYIAHPAGAQSLVFGDAIRATGWRIHQTLVWVKDTMVLGHSDYHYKHEPIFYGYTQGDGRPGRGSHAGTRWYGDHSQVSVFEVPRPKRSEDHPTMKPPELVAAMIKNSLQRGGVVLDPFAGSGSTFVAAEQVGRVCYGMEIDPGYAAVILERLAGMGLSPHRVTRDEE